jgi:CRP-like cAMP-binding protein
MEEIARLVTEFDAAPGHVLIERGQPATGVFLIESGAVRIDLPGGDHVERGAGSFFGELAVLADAARTARVSVIEDLRCLAIRRDDLMTLLDREPSIAVSMLREVARRLVEATSAH